MDTKPRRINKILEIDMDTEREYQLDIRQYASTIIPGRRQPDGNQDMLDNIVILENALMASILRAEEQGLCKKGEGIRKTLDNLMAIYVDASAVLTECKVNKDGTIVPGSVREIK